MCFFGMRYLAFGVWHPLFGTQCFKKHFVSISSVTFWHFYSTHAFRGARSLPEAVRVLPLGIQMQTWHSRNIRLHVHLNTRKIPKISPSKYKPPKLLTQKTLRKNAPPNISPPGGLYLEIALKYKVKQRKRCKLPSKNKASPINFETQISLRT